MNNELVPRLRSCLVFARHEGSLLHPERSRRVLIASVSEQIDELPGL